MKNTILLVDDEDANLELLQGLLKDDYTLVCAKNGPKALSLAAQKPDLILLDIMMPGMDGYEVCRRLKANEQTKQIPIIFIASKREMTDEIDGLKLGASDYIAKPITALEVKARVKAYLALRASDQSDEEQQGGCDFCRAVQPPIEAQVRLLDLLLKESTWTAEQKKSLLSVRHYGFHAQALLHLSLVMPPLEKGTYPMKPTGVDLLSLLRTIRANLDAELRNKRLTLKISLQNPAETEKNGFIVRGDKLLCYALLADQIERAVAASPPDQSVTVALEDAGRSGVVRINDMGQIPAAHSDHFFTKGDTVENQPAGRHRGYVARLLTEFHGGKIRMRSYETKGTEIVFSLPKGDANG